MRSNINYVILYIVRKQQLYQKILFKFSIQLSNHKFTSNRSLPAGGKSAQCLRMNQLLKFHTDETEMNYGMSEKTTKIVMEKEKGRDRDGDV